MQEHYYLPQRCLKTIGTLKYTDNTTIREAHITPINTTKTFTLLWITVWPLPRRLGKRRWLRNKSGAHALDDTSALEQHSTTNSLSTTNYQVNQSTIRILNEKREWVYECETANAQTHRQNRRRLKDNKIKALLNILRYWIG